MVSKYQNRDLNPGSQASKPTLLKTTLSSLSDKIQKTLNFISSAEKLLWKLRGRQDVFQRGHSGKKGGCEYSFPGKVDSMRVKRDAEKESQDKIQGHQKKKSRLASYAL